jgi:hypothetical protein
MTANTTATSASLSSEPRVFISHATTDREAVERVLLVLLRSHGVKPWYSRDDIHTTEDWERSIRRGLEECDWFLVVMTPRSAKSPWVKWELSWAMSEREDRVVPVLLETSDASDWHLGLRTIQHVDFRPGQDIARARSELLAVWGLSPRTDPAGAPSDSSTRPHSTANAGDGTDRAAVVIIINEDFERFDQAKQDAFLRSLAQMLLITGDIRVLKRGRGSVKLTLELTAQQAEQLIRAFKAGELAYLDVIDAWLLARVPVETGGSTAVPAEDEVRPEPSSATSDTDEFPSYQAPRTSRLHTFPGYEVLDEFGRGGFGVVYRAKQVCADRWVALKTLLSGSLLDDRQRNRYRSALQVPARLSHPNIVQLFEVGEHDGQPFCSLELCEGDSLAAKLRRGPLSPAEAARTLETLARAVHYMHERGVVHRDLKPAHVLFTADGTLKLSGFGLARKLDEPDSEEEGSVVGTPAYMAPEQAAGRNEKVGPAADIYALGGILYECLTGQVPFRGTTFLEMMEQVLTREPTPPRRLNPAVPRDVEAICLKCLRKEPNQRYLSAYDLATDLNRFRDGEPTLAWPVGAAARLVRWARRSPVAAAAVLLISLLSSGVITVLAVQESQLRTSVNQAQVEIDDLKRGKSRFEAAYLELERSQLQELRLRAEMETRLRKLDLPAIDESVINTAWPVSITLNKRTLTAGEPFTCTVTSAREGYLILVQIVPDREPLCLYPCDGKDVRIKAGQPITVDAIARRPSGHEALVAFVFKDRPTTLDLDDLARGAPKAISRTDLKRLILIDGLGGTAADVSTELLSDLDWPTTFTVQEDVERLESQLSPQQLRPLRARRMEWASACVQIIHSQVKAYTGAE